MTDLRDKTTGLKCRIHCASKGKMMNFCLENLLMGMEGVKQRVNRVVCVNMTC